MVFRFSLVYAPGMDQEADERKAIKNGSRHIGKDHKNKRAEKETKVVVEPEAKLVEASDDVPSANSRAKMHTQADNKVNITQIRAGRSVMILSDREKKELRQKLESWSQKFNMNNLKGIIKLVLKTELHCEGCIKKIRQELKKLEGVRAIAFDAGRDLVAVIGTVDEEKLVWYMEQKFKQEMVVVLLEKTNNSEKTTMSLSSPDVNVGSGGEKESNRDDIDEPVPDALVDDVEKKSQEDHTKASPAGNKPGSITSEPLMPVYEKDVIGIMGGMNNAGWSSLLMKWNKDMPETDEMECTYDMFKFNDHGMFNDDNPNIACSIM